MPLVKKLLFAPFFVISFGLLLYVLKPLLNSSDLAFGISQNTLVQTIELSWLILLSSFLFILFAALSQDWKIILGIAFAASLVPFLLFATPYSYIFAVGTFSSLGLTNLLLKNKLASYLTFQPVTLTLSPTKNLATLMVIVISVCYFLILDGQINQSGFQIPDSLIDMTMQLVPQMTDSSAQTNQLANFKLPPEQCVILQKNPELLRKQLPDPSILDLIDPKTCQVNSQKIEQPNSTVRGLIKTQFQQMLSPYKPYIAPLLAVLLATSLGFFNWIFSYILALIIWLTFWILTSTGFIKFEKEMREVKKLVV